MTPTRRKLAAVDDPLALGEPPPAPTEPSPEAQPDSRPATEALYVRLPTAESDLLARAAFELRVFKRELVAALIARHVDPHSDEGLARLRETVESHRQRAR